MTKPSELLERGWCKHAFAIDIYGNPNKPWSRYAAKWSLPGAIIGAFYESPAAQAEAFEKLLRFEQNPWRGVAAAVVMLQLENDLAENGQSLVDWLKENGL
jgi:hypothetical protein